MKLIVGFFETKPGQRQAYLEAAQDHLEKCRLDPDCLYIELVPMPEHADRILLAEAFTSEAGTGGMRIPTTCGRSGRSARSCCRAW